MTFFRFPRKEELSDDGLTTDRIEAFSDGVFAIAITLLILEIRIPEVGPGKSLQSALLAVWPSYFAYLMSFLMIGIYWANHHYIFKLYKRTDHYFNLLNVLFLMCISFMPLPTSILGKYLLNDLQRPTAVQFYALGMLLPAFCWMLCWLYAKRGYRLIDEDLDEGFVHALTMQYIFSNIFYLAAYLAAFHSAIASLALNVGLTLLYMSPPRRPVYRSGRTP
ncbi:MAG: TMEM175 family protein [Capsulimonadales bacterium]|nr:TMEM175 family protein [Capsulimonadales bacterium]